MDHGQVKKKAARQKVREKVTKQVDIVKVNILYSSFHGFPD